MSFSEFYTAGKGLFDAYSEGANNAEAVKLYDEQLNAALRAQQAQAMPTNGLAALGQMQPAAPKVPTFATSGGSLGSYLDTVRGKESGGNDFAKNPNSTATGRYQFTEGTWNGLARKYPQLGLTPGGRNDPAQQERAMQAFTKDNSDALSRAGVPITPGNLYVSHFLGEAGGPRFIAGALSNPDAPATAFVTPGAAAANRTIFFNRDGTPKRAGDVYAERTSRFGGGQALVPTRVASAGDATAMPPMGMPSMAMPQGAPRVMPQQMAEADANPADMPVPNAQPVSFQIPGEAPQSDFVPGTVASPAIQTQGGQGGGMGLAPAAAQRLSPGQVENLRAMIRNPNTRAYAAKIIEGLNKPSEFSFQVVGDQLVRTSKDGRAEVVPNITKPPTFQTVKGSDGNDYTFNPQTGGWTRAIQGRGDTVRNLTTPEERAQYGIPESYTGPAQVDANNKLMFPGSGQMGITPQDATDKDGSKVLTDRFDAIGKEGAQGRNDLPLIGELKALGNDIGTGAVAAAKARLGEYGIKFEGSGKIEAYNALLDRLTPQQRIAGAGATSDFDAKMFKGSLQRLINTPEGNALITDTLEAVANDRVRRGEIADLALLGPKNGGITQQEALKRLRDLPSVQTGFAKRMSELQKAGKLAPVQAQPSGGQQSQPQPAAAPPSAAVDYLRQNMARDPGLRGAFDAKYGAGAADRVLRGASGGVL